MNRLTAMRIHKEGYKMIPFMFLLTAVLYALLCLLIPFSVVRVFLGVAAVVFMGFVVYFFRDPHVETPVKDGMVYAPAAGKVVVIERTYEGEYIKDDCIQVSIFMSPLDVHVNRSPVKGEVNFYRYHPGTFLVAWHPKSSTDNERTSIGFKSEGGYEILMRQVAGAVARRIRFYLDIGDEVDQGSKVGFIRFGSRVDLYLPIDSKIKVNIGDLTGGGVTEIAKLPG